MFAVLVAVDFTRWHVVALRTVAVLQDDNRVSLLACPDTTTTASKSQTSLGVARVVRLFPVTFITVQIPT